MEQLSTESWNKKEKSGYQSTDQSLRRKMQKKWQKCSKGLRVLAVNLTVLNANVLTASSVTKIYIPLETK